MCSTLADSSAAIGNTPLVQLRNIGKDLPGRIAVKLEYMNPSGSVKDRAALRMVEAAEKKGLITPGKTVLIEGTAGNFGVSIAMVAQIKGYKCLLFMSNLASLERRALILAYGAELILLDPIFHGEAMLKRIKEVEDAHPDFYWINQFDNADNVEAHYTTTGPEIYKQTDGKVDILCLGGGSFGTVMGAGKYLKERKPEVLVYVVEPDENAMLSRGGPPKRHGISGISPGFIARNADRSLIDGILTVKTADALEMARRLTREEAIPAGISSGANVIAALELAARPENAGKLIVTAINSSGERYLSTALYADIKATAEGLPCLSLEESIATAKKLLS